MEIKLKEITFGLIISLITCVTIALPAEVTRSSNILDIEPPKYFVFGQSPLSNPTESLKQQQYYNFLNTLYRHDRSKANLFEIPAVATPPQILSRQKRFTFRPLFVYREQELRRQKFSDERRRRRYRY